MGPSFPNAGPFSIDFSSISCNIERCPWECPGNCSFVFLRNRGMRLPLPEIDLSPMIEKFVQRPVEDLNMIILKTECPHELQAAQYALIIKQQQDQSK